MIFLIQRARCYKKIKVNLGGRIAEEIIFDDITTGASADIRNATSIARSMVMDYGMSDELGLIHYSNGESDEVFLGRDLGHQRSYGENVQSIIDREIKKIIDECYQDAKRIILEHMDIMHRCVELLLEKDRIDGPEFEALFEDKNEVI